MNVLFITLFDIRSIDNYGIYEDLLREYFKRGHRIYVVTPSERRHHEKTHRIQNSNAVILKVRTGNIQKTNLIEKGIATVLLERQFISAIKKHLPDVKFDLVLYSTPPITLAGVVQYIKKRDGAKSYLMLKDIFPQNAVDIGMMTKSGVKGILYRYFRKKEKKLYALSDFIGCMSQANVDYVVRNNPEISQDKVEICPNAVEVRDTAVAEEDRLAIRKKYGIPTDKKVFIYGGNLGRPQGIPFLMEALKSCRDHPEAFFLIVGDGTEYKKLEAFFAENKLPNALLLKRLPKEDYDLLALSADVGMIFLDHRFTIPNFPSRLLAYLQAKIPVLACTDPNTDVGKVITEGGFGWWCESCDPAGFCRLVDVACESDLAAMGALGYEYHLQNYTSENAYGIIMDSITK